MLLSCLILLQMFVSFISHIWQNEASQTSAGFDFLEASSSPGLGCWLWVGGRVEVIRDNRHKAIDKNSQMSLGLGRKSHVALSGNQRQTR